MGVGSESRGGSLYIIIVTIFLEHRLRAITPVISGRGISLLGLTLNSAFRRKVLLRSLIL